MAELYEQGYNPYEDYLVQLMLNDIDISSDKTQMNIYNVFSSILSYYLNNENDLVYLDFEITNNDGYFKLKPANFICALWFSGIMFDNTNTIAKSNSIEFEGYKYSFDKKNRELIVEEIK